MIQMSKEEFVILLERWRSSGLSIKDFCVNEAYTVSSFYYWKSKFGFSRSYRSRDKVVPAEKFAPVSFKSPTASATFSESAKRTSQSSTEEICIDLPTGVSVRFKGELHSEIALSLLSQICSNYVLPK